jgi:hypothetical protein
MLENNKHNVAVESLDSTYLKKRSLTPPGRWKLIKKCNSSVVRKPVIHKHKLQQKLDSLQENKDFSVEQVVLYFPLAHMYASPYFLHIHSSTAKNQAIKSMYVCGQDVLKIS